MFRRNLVQQIEARIAEPRHFIQVVTGPRQTGKTTAVTQALEGAPLPYRFTSADDATVLSREWLANEWALARTLVSQSKTEALLVIDEVQKVPQWTTVVKSLWDEDSRKNVPLKVLLTGSSTMLLRKGLEESLMGRFELLYSHHWSLAECREAFAYSLDDFLFFGGYPGAAPLIKDEARWARYMETSIVEPTISLDVLSLGEVRKPALLRALFKLGASYSAQELSYTKILGQLQDAGNTVTLAHYLDLLTKAEMLCGLQKFSKKAVKIRSSSPRLMVFDTSLLTYADGSGRGRLRDEAGVHGHLVESAIGAHLLARSKEEGFDVYWWRERGKEVDFVVQQGDRITAIEVKSGRVKGLSGSQAFMEAYPEALLLVVGSSACTVEDFLLGTTPLFK
jgi:predicted AAA+ superfamily ATPase